MKNEDFPNFEAYAAMMQKTMQDALANIDAVAADARKERDAAIKEQIALREALKKVEQDARQEAIRQLDLERKRLENDVRTSTMNVIIEKLFRAGRSRSEIQEWLDAPLEQVEKIRIRLNITTNESKDAFVEIEGTVRAGKIHYREGDTRLDFEYEMGGGNCLVLIFVPEEAHWVAQTGLPLSGRLSILDFVAQQVIEKNAPGYHYEISTNAISILK
jgi:hypothetical protein